MQTSIQNVAPNFLRTCFRALYNNPSTVCPPCTAPGLCPDPRYALRKVLSAATPGSREAGLRRLEESGVRVLARTRVGSVKEGGVVVLQGEGVRGSPCRTNLYFRCTLVLFVCLFYYLNRSYPQSIEKPWARVSCDVFFVFPTRVGPVSCLPGKFSAPASSHTTRYGEAFFSWENQEHISSRTSIVYVRGARLAFFTSQYFDDVMLRMFVSQKRKHAKSSQRRDTAVRLPPIVPPAAASRQH